MRLMHYVRVLVTTRTCARRAPHAVHAYSAPYTSLYRVVIQGIRTSVCVYIYTHAYTHAYTHTHDIYDTTSFTRQPTILAMKTHLVSITYLAGEAATLLYLGFIT